MFGNGVTAERTGAEHGWLRAHGSNHSRSRTMDQRSLERVTRWPLIDEDGGEYTSSTTLVVPDPLNTVSYHGGSEFPPHAP